MIDKKNRKLWKNLEDNQKNNTSDLREGLKENVWNIIDNLTIEEQTIWIKLHKSKLEELISVAEKLTKELEDQWVFFEKPKIPELWDDMAKIILEYDKIYSDLTEIIAKLKSIKWEDNDKDIKTLIESDKIFLEKHITVAKSLIDELENKWIVFKKTNIPEIPKWDDLDKLTIDYLYTYMELKKIIKYLLSKKWVTWDAAEIFIDSIDYPDNEDEK